METSGLYRVAQGVVACDAMTAWCCLSSGRPSALAPNRMVLAGHHLVVSQANVTVFAVAMGLAAAPFFVIPLRYCRCCNGLDRPQATPKPLQHCAATRGLVVLPLVVVGRGGGAKGCVLGFLNYMRC